MSQEPDSAEAILARLDTGEIVRLARPADFAAIAAIYHFYVLDGNSTADLVPKTYQEWLELFEDLQEREAILVLEFHGEILGYGTIRSHSPKKGYAPSCETGTYLAPDHRGKKLGTRFKKALMAHCRTLGYRNLIARIFADNHVSIGYNLKLGYQSIGIIREAAFLHGRWRDVALLQYLDPEVPPPQ